MNNTRALLRQYGLSPKKSFGQNFLVQDRVVEAIAKACVPDDERGKADVIELGAGLGALTQLLIDRAAHVTAVERDRDLVPILETHFAADIAANRLRVLEADAQAIRVDELLKTSGAPRVLCGNLPYQITGSLLQRAVEQAESIDRAIFMVQNEVADRLVAHPSTKAYGALTVFVTAAFQVDRVMTVSRGAFLPMPDVTSAVVRLIPKRPRITEETELFRQLVKGAFGMRRKTLRNAWKSIQPNRCTVAEACEQAGVSLDARGETLSVEAFAKVAKALA